MSEPTERDVEELAAVLHSEVPGIECSHAEFIPCEHDARAVIASDWYAERIAQARREGAAEAEARITAALALLPECHRYRGGCAGHRDPCQPCLLRAALRGEASPPPGPDYAPTGGPVSPFGPFPKAD